VDVKHHVYLLTSSADRKLGAGTAGDAGMMKNTP